MSNNNIPTLRFPEFKGGWQYTIIASLIEKMQSGLSRKLSDSDIGLPVIRSNNIIDGKISIEEIKYWYRLDNQGAKTENYFLQEGDILVNFINSIAQIGKVGIYENLLNRDVIFTTNILRLSLKKECGNSVFIFYLFQLKSYWDFIQSITKPAVNQASFTTKDFQQYPIYIPSLREQQKIASFLTAVDKKIAQLQRKKELLEQYKKGVMQQIFSQQLRFKDEQGNDYPDWEVKKLSEITSVFKSGNGITSNDISETGKYPVYGGNGLRGYTDTYTHDGYFALIGRQGALCGNINRVTGKSFISEHAIAVQGNANGDTEWLAQKLEYMNLNRLSESSAQPGLSVNKLLKMKIETPAVNEQKKIGHYLMSLDKKIELVLSEIERAQYFKKGLLQQMFV